MIPFSRSSDSWFSGFANSSDRSDRHTFKPLVTVHYTEFEWRIFDEESLSNLGGRFEIWMVFTLMNKTLLHKFFKTL